MVLYRLMCKAEFDCISEQFPISWNSRFKWFTDNVDFLKRVSDGNFNNSRFMDRYLYLVIYEIENDCKLRRVSTNELMLRRTDQPMLGIRLIKKVGSNWECKL